MRALDRIAYYQNRRDEVANQELAAELAAAKEAGGISEIAAHLWDKNSSVSSDCLKVLYEIGYIDPHLIAGYASDFLKLLNSKNNRMVWGGMIALACVAPLCPQEIWPQVDDVIDTVEHGSVITVVWGVRALARVAAANNAYSARIFPVLLKQLQTCIPRDVPTHAESMVCAVNETNKSQFMAVLTARQPELTPSQLARLRRAVKGVAA
jgi:hypothetical protein